MSYPVQILESYQRAERAVEHKKVILIPIGIGMVPKSQETRLEEVEIGERIKTI